MSLYKNILAETQKLKSSLLDYVKNCEYYDYDSANKLAVFFLDMLESAICEHFDALEREIDEYELSRLIDLSLLWYQSELDSCSICFDFLPDEAQLYADGPYIGRLFIAQDDEYYEQMEEYYENRYF